jgi:quercetin dioxygenase-like cupin family protein
MPPRLLNIDPMMFRINLREEKTMSMSSTSEVGGETAGAGSGPRPVLVRGATEGPGPASVLVRGAGVGPGTWSLGSLFERLASGEETGGGFALSLVTQPPGAATPVHIHALEDEAFYLLDGTMTYSADGELHRLARGSFIFLRRGLPHAFRVTGDAPVQFLAIASPGALMSLYDEAGRPAGEHELPPPDQEQLMADVHRWLETAPRYGLSIVGPPLPADV